jgi:hypothetical protein
MYKKYLSYKIGMLLIASLVFVSTITAIDYNSLFWDFSVYRRAVYDFSMGKNPYRTDELFLFVYHPYILYLFTYFEKLFSLTLTLILFFGITSFLFFKLILELVGTKNEKLKLDKKHSAFWLLVPSFCFGGAGIVAIKTGNLTLYLHFLVISIFLSIKKNKSAKGLIFFSTSTVFISLIKPYYMAYLILLLYLTNYKNAALYLLAGVFLFSAIWFSASIFVPNLYDKFLAALTFQTIGQGDLGYSVFGLIRRFLGNSAAIFLHGAIMLCMLAGFVVIVKKAGYKLSSDELMPLVITFIIFLNPRMKEYDFPIAVLFICIFIYKINIENYLKVMMWSWSIATVPIITNYAVKMGFLNPAIYLNSLQLYQIIGFFVISIHTIICIYNQRSPNFKLH